MDSKSGARWAYWRCPLCERVATYPAPPAGPGAPQCTYGHGGTLMEPVQVIKKVTEDDAEYIDRETNKHVFGV